MLTHEWGFCNKKAVLELRLVIYIQNVVLDFQNKTPLLG